MFALTAIPCLWTAAAAQSTSKLKLDTGEEIFQAGCAGCHGADGKGQPQHVLGFEPPATFPDFTDCNGSTRESALQWSAIIHQGGHARAFSPIMPSFGPRENPALTDDQIGKVIRYLRTFCTEDAKWPSGEFNIPRPMVTEKSFPEDEVILYFNVNLDGSAGVENQLMWEKRLGPVTNMKLRLNGNFTEQPSGNWRGGLGDVAFELKRDILVKNRTGSLLAWGSELLVPSGNPENGGEGVTKLESYLALTQLLPKQSFVQLQVGAEAPFRRHDTPAQAFTRAAVGRTFLADHGFGRAFSITNEFVASREFARGEAWRMNVVPQMQVTLSKRQHIRLAAGVNVPAVNTAGQQKVLMFYLLWDTFDGQLNEGWR